MKNEGVGGVCPLAERDGVAKTGGRRRALCQSGGPRGEFPGAVPGNVRRRPGVTGSGASRVAAAPGWVDE